MLRDDENCWRRPATTGLIHLVGDSQYRSAGRAQSPRRLVQRRCDRGAVLSALGLMRSYSARRIKIVSIIDEHTRECRAGMVERSTTGEHLIAELDRLATQPDTYPALLRRDNVPELVCSATANWTIGQVGLNFISPGEPWRTGYVHRSNSRIRDECLSVNSFWSPAQAQHDYNQCRRHSSLGYLPPARYAAGCTHR